MVQWNQVRCGELMTRLIHVIESIANIGGYLSGWLVPLMMLLILYEVIMRYIVHRPPIIADEFSAYMLVTLCFLGMAYTWKERGHVRITALVSRLPARIASWIRLGTLVLALVIGIMMSQAIYAYLVYSFKYHMRSATHLLTPLQGPQMTMLIGFILLCPLLIVEIARAIMNIRSGKRVEEATR